VLARQPLVEPCQGPIGNVGPAWPLGCFARDQLAIESMIAEGLVVGARGSEMILHFAGQYKRGTVEAPRPAKEKPQPGVSRLGFMASAVGLGCQPIQVSLRFTVSSAPHFCSRVAVINRLSTAGRNAANVNGSGW
jgi:hypothetical protein